jgi:hypothetical protein
MNVSTYQAKAYPSPPCWQLVADVYTTELGQEVEGYKTISGSVRAIASALRLALHKNADGFQQIEEPADYAVVLMGGQRRGLHHCGIYYQGKVLHALPQGTLYQDLASLRDEYELIEYWAKT